MLREITHGRTYSCNQLLTNLIYLLLTNMLFTLKEFLTYGTLKVSFVRCRNCITKHRHTCMYVYYVRAATYHRNSLLKEYKQYKSRSSIETLTKYNGNIRTKIKLQATHIFHLVFLHCGLDLHSRSITSRYFRAS